MGLFGEAYTLPNPKALGSKDSYSKAFGPKDHIIYGFWAILSLRVRVQVPYRIYFGLSVYLCHYICRYFRASVSTIWVHGPLGSRLQAHKTHQQRPEASAWKQS